MLSLGGSLMPTLQIAPGLYAFALTLENGTTRNVLASSLASAIGGILPSPVVAATRGEAIAGDGSSPALVPPVLGSLVPATAVAGTPGFTLRVLGSGFRPDSRVVWNGAPVITTTFVSATEISTVIPSTAYPAGPIPVSAVTIGGLESNALTFSITVAARSASGPASAPPLDELDAARGL